MYGEKGNWIYVWVYEWVKWEFDICMGKREYYMDICMGCILTTDIADRR